MSTLVAADFTTLAARVRSADVVVARGAGTRAGIGGRVPFDAVEVSAPAGLVDLQPADMTVTVLAGTPVASLNAALADFGQECPLDPEAARATVGGVLAAGLSGRRRLGLGPLRDTVLEVVLVLADGRVVRGGGPTVKNVTGYDLPRLVVGSLGTLGVLARVTLRTRPRPRVSTWFSAPRERARGLRHDLFAPMAVLESAVGAHVLLEGHPDDVAAESARASLAPGDAPPAPADEHRGRIAVAPTRLPALVADLDAVGGLTVLAEHGVGTVHVGSVEPTGLAAARAVAGTHGGWLLRETGAPDLDPFGVTFPAPALQARVRAAFDPTGKLAPGRIPA